MLKGKRIKRSVLKKLVAFLFALDLVLTLTLVINVKQKAIPTISETSPVQEAVIAPTVAENVDFTPVNELIVSEQKCLGKFKITWYCGCEECNGENANLDAHGQPLVEGVVASNDISQFTHILIDLGDGLQEYEVRDRMAERYTGMNCIDIYTTDHEFAMLNGVQYANVYLKQD